MKTKVPLALMVLRQEKWNKQFPIGSRWRHNGNGNEYIIIGHVNVANWNKKYPPEVVYISVINKNWWTKRPRTFLKTMTLLAV